MFYFGRAPDDSLYNRNSPEIAQSTRCEVSYTPHCMFLYGSACNWNDSHIHKQINRTNYGFINFRFFARLAHKWWYGNLV